MRSVIGRREAPRGRKPSASAAAVLGIAAVLAACGGDLTPALHPPPPVAPSVVPSASGAAPAESSVVWREDFAGATLDWVAPFGDAPDKVARIYSVVRGPAGSFLHARYDGRPDHDTPPPIHFGHALEAGVPLEREPTLSWKWRVRTHPSVGDDAWLDVAASLYVITQTPSLLFRGRGFKFGWTVHGAAAGTYQHGLLQVELRHDPASEDWRSEAVDLCALYREAFGSCEGERVRYVGVVTDADGSRSVAEAEYGELEIRYGKAGRANGAGRSSGL